MSEVTHQVLFVCTGNTCRSPMAEGMFKQMTANHEHIQCIGSAGVSAYPGDHMSRDSAVILHNKGTTKDQLSVFRSRPVSKELLEQATHVFAMTEGHLQMLMHQFPSYEDKYFLVCDFVEFDGQVGIDVPDPIGQGQRAYQMVSQVFEDALTGVILYLESLNENK